MIRYIFASAATITIVTVSIFMVGCETNAQNDALIGGAIGAGAGAIIGHQSGHAGTGALIGGAAGAAGGYIIGNEQDKKQSQSQSSTVRPQANVVTVNVTNSNGSITPVKLTQQGNNLLKPN
jgi:uncharacterized protein YcfJ